MSKFIDAEKLIAGIKHLQDKFPFITYEALFHLITSLQQEQPEVDLEEYIENEINHYGLSLYEASYGTFSASEIDRIMRKFYELGLNARKEE